MTSKKGFSTIELLVIVGLLTVLTAFTIAGISAFLRFNRDQERIIIANEMVNQINSYKIINLKYPERDNIFFSNNKFQIRDANGEFSELNLEGAQQVEKVLSKSTPNSTKYIYNAGATCQDCNSGFMLCVKLESGETQSFGTVDLCN